MNDASPCVPDYCGQTMHDMYCGQAMNDASPCVPDYCGQVMNDMYCGQAMNDVSNSRSQARSPGAWCWWRCVGETLIIWVVSITHPTKHIISGAHSISMRRRKTHYGRDERDPRQFYLSELPPERPRPDPSISHRAITQRVGVQRPHGRAPPWLPPIPPSPPASGPGPGGGPSRLAAVVAPSDKVLLMIERLARRRRRLGHHVVVLSLLRVLEDRWRCRWRWALLRLLGRRGARRVAARHVVRTHVGREQRRPRRRRGGLGLRDRRAAAA